MIEVYKYLNGHSRDIKNYIFKLREGMYGLLNIQIFEIENLPSSKYGLNAIPHRASQIWQQVPIDMREVTSSTLFKNRIKTWKCEDFPCTSCKIFIQNVAYI